MRVTADFEEWVEEIVYALMMCPDVHHDEVPDLIYQRQKELEQEPSSD